MQLTANVFNASGVCLAVFTVQQGWGDPLGLGMAVPTFFWSLQAQNGKYWNGYLSNSADGGTTAMLSTGDCFAVLEGYYDSIQVGQTFTLVERSSMARFTCVVTQVIAAQSCGRTAARPATTTGLGIA